MEELGKINLKKIKIKINPEDLKKAGIILGGALATTVTGGSIAPAIAAAGSQILRETGKRFMEREITSKMIKNQKEPEIKAVSPQPQPQQGNLWLFAGVILLILMFLILGRKRK